MLPKYLVRIVVVIAIFSLSFSINSFIPFLITEDITLSSPLTPDSLVYPSIISFKTLSEIVILFFTLYSFIFLGTKYFLAIFNFSSEVYPDTSIISILSKSGLGIVSKELAVVINITLDKSKGTSR